MFSAITAVGIVSVVINALVLADAGGFVNYGNEVAIPVTVLSAALTAFGVLAFTCSFYSFKGECLIARFALLGDKINYRDMTALRLDEKTNELYLVYNRAKKEIVREEALLFMLNPNEYDAVWKKLSVANPEIVYEIISE
jgi:hypothetical protein